MHKPVAAQKAAKILVTIAGEQVLNPLVFWYVGPVSLNGDDIELDTLKIYAFQNFQLTCGAGVCLEQWGA